jgi:hypothetical protein
MLTLIGETKGKRAAQAVLESNLKNVLEPAGVHRIGFHGGNIDLPIYAAGEGKLWVGFGGSIGDAAERRYWNAFGVYRPDRPTQSITVEINVPIDSNGARVAGFLAKDSASGHIFLMHSGKVGGGRPGIGKSAFLIWSMAKCIEVSDENGGFRTGIAVSVLRDPSLASRIWTFVRSVQSFKDEAARGALETPEFTHRVEEFERYSKEFSGKKQGTWGGSFEYVTYHGDIVQKLYEERAARLSPDEKVFNSNLIDLYVTNDGVLSEVYEVKTGVGRQMLYTAIGQVLTHATNSQGKVVKYIVIPGDDSIPDDLKQAIAMLGIKLRRFRLTGAACNRSVELD